MNFHGISSCIDAETIAGKQDELSRGTSCKIGKETIDTPPELPPGE
jgi:hypothetical protein